MDGLLLGLAERDLHKKLNIMIDEVKNIRHSMASEQPLPAHTMTTVQYDWQNPEFQGACEAIDVDFFNRHPEIVRGSGEFARRYPEKEKGIGTLDRLSELNRIHPDEYVLLYKEILNF